MSGLWYDFNTQELVFPDNSRIPFSQAYNVSHPGLMSYTGLGGLHGGYRTPTQATHGSSFNGTYPGNPGAQAQLAHYQAINTAHSQALAAAFASQRAELGKKIEYAGVKAGEIIAYRCWLIRGNPANVLTSCFVEVVWHPGIPMTGDVGGDYCICTGVHSLKTKKLALDYGDGYKANYCALGRVKLWGEVIEHEKGYRAENAKIMSIDQVLNPKDDQRILRQLRKRYGVNEYANGNDTGSRQVGPGCGEEERSSERLGWDDLPSESRDSRKGGCWNYLRGLIQRRGV